MYTYVICGLSRWLVSFLADCVSSCKLIRLILRRLFDWRRLSPNGTRDFHLHFCDHYYKGSAQSDKQRQTTNKLLIVFLFKLRSDVYVFFTEPLRCAKGALAVPIVSLKRSIGKMLNLFICHIWARASLNWRVCLWC